MSRFVAVAVGPPLALFVSIALIETDRAGTSAIFLGALVGGVTTYLLVPTRYRAKGGALAFGFASLVLAFMVTWFGTLIWLFQYIPD